MSSAVFIFTVSHKTANGQEKTSPFYLQRKSIAPTPINAPVSAPMASNNTSFQSHLLYGLTSSPYSFPNPVPIDARKPPTADTSIVPPMKLSSSDAKNAISALTPKCCFLSFSIFMTIDFLIVSPSHLETAEHTSKHRWNHRESDKFPVHRLTSEELAEGVCYR